MKNPCFGCKNRRAPNEIMVAILTASCMLSMLLRMRSRKKHIESGSKKTP